MHTSCNANELSKYKTYMSNLLVTKFTQVCISSLKCYNVTGSLQNFCCLTLQLIIFEQSYSVILTGQLKLVCIVEEV